MSDHGKAGIERLKELEQRLNRGNTSPTLKIPNGQFPGMLNNLFASDGADPMKGGFPGINPSLLADMQDDSNNNNNGAGGKMKEYQCSFCPFSTPYYAFLFIHERSHSLMNPSVNSALLRNNVSPMLQNANNHPAGLLNEFGQFKDQPQPFSNQSEAAVSIAKDMLPMNLGQPIAASITPGSTPASTPGMGSGIAALDFSGTAAESEEEEQPPRKKSRPNSVVKSENLMRKFAAVGDTIPMGKLSKTESSYMLKDMANLTKRPAIYALPREKDSEPMIMQSFLIEETRQKKLCNDAEEDSENIDRQLSGADALALVMNGGGGEVRKAAVNGGIEGGEPRHRFVPAVVFLPVRERISTPVTISFTLTPA